MPLDQRTLAATAFEKLYELILSGELPLGGVVNELALAQRFDISRGPIREAVQRLQGLKLITREPYMRARVVSLAPSDVLEIFQLREAVEGIACRLATEHMSDDELLQLGQSLEQSRPAPAGAIRKSKPIQQSGDRTSFDLHVRIADRCGNSRVRQLLCEELYHLLHIYRRRSGATPGRRSQAFDEHWQIVRAMQNRDGQLAESLMRSHIRRATESLSSQV